MNFSQKITPKVDIAFKKLFGVEENKDLLISLINSIVDEADQVSEVTLLNPYNPQNFRSDKLSIFDIKAKGINGKLFDIEIQIADEADYDKRVLFYWGRLYTGQLKSGSDYGSLNKAIGIHILNFFLTSANYNSPKYHNSFHLTEKELGFQYFSDLEIHIIELKKFSDDKTDLTSLLSKVKTKLDQWVTFLTQNDLLDKDNLPLQLTEVPLKKAIQVLEVMNFDDTEREFYEDHLKWLRIEANSLKKAEMKGEEKRNIEIAKNLLAKKMNPDFISEVTGLTEEEIQKIKSN